MFILFCITVYIYKEREREILIFRYGFTVERERSKEATQSSCQPRVGETNHSSPAGVM